MEGRKAGRQAGRNRYQKGTKERKELGCKKVGRKGKGRKEGRNW